MKKYHEMGVNEAPVQKVLQKILPNNFNSSLWRWSLYEICVFPFLFYLSQESMKAESSSTVSILGKIFVMRKILNGENSLVNKKMDNVFLRDSQEMFSQNSECIQHTNRLISSRSGNFWSLRNSLIHSHHDYFNGPICPVEVDFSHLWADLDCEICVLSPEMTKFCLHYKLACHQTMNCFHNQLVCRTPKWRLSLVHSLGN